MTEYIYNFNDKPNLSKSDQKKLLGSKGFNLSEISKLGLPVPSGFTITTEVCNQYFKNNNRLPEELRKLIQENISLLEKQTGKIFGSSENPLLLSVRSGALISMPGMMDTILNLGLNDEIVESFAKSSGNESLAYDCYLRFVEMFSNVALDIKNATLERIRTDFFSKNNLEDTDKLSTSQVKALVTEYKLSTTKAGLSFPENPVDQLSMAIIAVINSWNSNRAKIYRKLNHISDDLGTAVTVQSMVFGNRDELSGTGVLFTRNPVSGTKEIYGEYLINAQGEDVVAGKRTPLPIKDSASSMEHTMPLIYKELEGYCNRLEEFYKDMQDIEFTIESGKLYILQTRTGKRSARSAVKIAYDMTHEHILTRPEALLKIDPAQLDQLLHPTISKSSNPVAISKGLAASPGAATGRVVFSSEKAEEISKKEPVILLRNDTCPEDIKGMSISKGIVTSRGGLTSHAAVVARGMGKPCVCGINELQIDYDNKTARVGDVIIKELDVISMDGSTGEIYLGEVDVEQAENTPEFEKIIEWADEVRSLKIRANAETIFDVNSALSFGAEGIGLCRTEHMFFDEEKISLVRQMILAGSKEGREDILNRLLKFHTNDFISIFELMEDKPINIRLIDPPLHEFLPRLPHEINELAKQMNVEASFIEYQLEKLTESNPMLGHRGCRLGVTHPDIYQMQVNAIILAAIKTNKEGIEIMLPLISTEAELVLLKKLVTDTAEQVMIDHGVQIEYKIGTMIELPRAALMADKIAKHVDFFSFGTNDLTQTVFGISRDDIASFMPEYRTLDILKEDPFVTIDQEGVGEMVGIAIERGKKSNPNISLGICGEHGGDPKSIEFFHKIGMDYVSCSPFRIPIAKLAAAQAALKSRL